MKKKNMAKRKKTKQKRIIKSNSFYELCFYYIKLPKELKNQILYLLPLRYIVAILETLSDIDIETCNSKYDFYCDVIECGSVYMLSQTINLFDKQYNYSDIFRFKNIYASGNNLCRVVELHSNINIVENIEMEQTKLENLLIDGKKFKNLIMLKINELNVVGNRPYDFSKHLLNLNNLRKLFIDFDFYYDYFDNDSVTYEHNYTGLNHLRKLECLELSNLPCRIDNCFNELLQLKELKLGFLCKECHSDIYEDDQNYYNIENYDINCTSINNSLYYLTNLQILVLENYDLPLGDSLSTLINLKSLHLSHYDEPLGNSLHNLINLETLDLGLCYNRPLENSLSNLVNLKTLYLSNNFNHNLNNSLDNLISLTYLEIKGRYNKPFGDSLHKLVNLRTLKISNDFDKPFGNSLHNLVNLEYLSIYDEYDISFGNSLSKLINLKTLSIGYYFNKPFGKSLYNLINLEHLEIRGNYNISFGNSLQNLKNLKTLKIQAGFNKWLNNCLYNLTKLEHLYISDSYKKSLGKSLSKLINLKTLTIYGRNCQELNDSLHNLVNLQHLIIGSDYDKQLTDYNYANLNNLEKITFSANYRKPIIIGKNILPKLKEIHIHSSIYREVYPIIKVRDDICVIKTNVGDGYDFIYYKYWWL